MIAQTIYQIESELKELGFTDSSIDSYPPIVNRIIITMNMAKLWLRDGQKLTEADQKWCEHYAQYIHMFDSDRMEKLGELYFSLIEAMKAEKCFE